MATPTRAPAGSRVYTSLEFSPKAGGQRVKHEEVGLYTVKNDLVTREEFFYDGAFIWQPRRGLPVSRSKTLWRRSAAGRSRDPIPIVGSRTLHCASHNCAERRGPQDYERN